MPLWGETLDLIKTILLPIFGFSQAINVCQNIVEIVCLARFAEYQKLGEGEALKPPLVIPVPPATVSIVRLQEPHFAAHALSVVPHGADSLLINAVPACFLRRQCREVISKKKL